MKIFALVLVLCLVVSMSFIMSFLFTGQAMADNTNTVTLENKDAGWNPILGDGIYGTLTYTLINPTFNYVFQGHGLDNVVYDLIYYADGWPGNNPGALIGSGTPMGGLLVLAGQVELNMDLPDPADANYPTGAKIWLVPASDYNEGTRSMTAFNPSKYLFDMELITYQDAPNPYGEVCFIATAAYGTSTAEEIDVLRSFRDQVLLESTLGSQFVAWYYQMSPPVAEFISGSSLLKTVVRELLIDPMVSIVTFTQGIWGD